MTFYILHLASRLVCVKSSDSLPQPFESILAIINEFEMINKMFDFFIDLFPHQLLMPLCFIILK